jgi:anti-anti-sigma factor
VTEEDFGPDSRLFAVEGELDLAVADQLQEALDRAAGDGKRALMLDLGRCDFIDSTGIAVIMRGQMASPDRKLVVFGACGGVERVFSVTGFDEHEYFVAGIEEARALLSLPEPA